MNMPEFTAEKALISNVQTYFNGFTQSIALENKHSKVQLSMTMLDFRVRPLPPVRYVCSPALNQCGCYSVLDCMDLFLSGKCSGDWACGAGGCSCTHNPPIA